MQDGYIYIYIYIHIGHHRQRQAAHKHSAEEPGAKFVNSLISRFPNFEMSESLNVQFPEFPDFQISKCASF